jgi:hypothetical protein
MQTWIDKVALILLTLWVGSLWAIGGIAAPVLFYQIHDTQLAGQLAGEMFKLLAYFGLFAGVVLLLHSLMKQGGRAFKQGYIWLIIIMLLLTVAMHFGIAPILAQLKQDALPADVMNSVFANRFERWHGVSSAAFMLQSLLGLWAVLKAPR